jgi:hypothetical protein
LQTNLMTPPNDPGMRRLRMPALLVAAALGVLLAVAPAQASVDVGVSVQISQPGVYGRIDIGRFPQPQVIVNQPVLVVPGPRQAVVVQPIYMWVPPGHRNNWGRHCQRYNACHVPVVFVEDAWYEKNVKPAKGRPGKPGERGNGPGRRD